MRIASTEDGEIKVRVDRSTREIVVGWGIAVMTASFAAYVHTLFAPVAPPRVLWTWSAVNAVVFVFQIGLPTAAFIRRPSAEEVRRVWARLGKVAAVIFSLNLAGSIWFLLPYADPQLRLLMVVFYLAACCWQVVSAADSILTLAYYIATIMGSAVVFFLRLDDPYATPVALFLAIFASLLLGAALSLRTTVRSALEARLEAERAAAALEVALADARTAREERERFMAAASHDLRQPIHAATLFFQQMLKTRDPAVRAQAEAGVRLAFEETDALLEQMLDHLRLEASAVAPRLEPLSVAGLFTRAVAESAAIAGAASVRLDAAPTGLWVLGDRAMATGVLRNFIHNALRHADGQEVRLLARPRRGRVRLCVVDDGRGVPPEERAGLFQPYVQGRRSGQQARSGLGLGLASARRMAELLGGEVGLDPGWRGGAAFYLELPRARPAPAKAAPVSRPAPSGAGRRVLILDDDDAAREALAGLFATEGWSVRTAADALAARRLVEAGRCDLLISDWRLADGATGAQAVDEVRRADPRLPAMLITGDGSRESHAAIAATGLPVLFKPTAPARILALARQLSAPPG